MHKYQDIIGRLNYGLFLTVVALLPFPQIALRYTCVIWFILWVLEGRWLRKPNFKSQISNLKFAIPFIFFGAWYAWKLISGCWAADGLAWSEQMERYLAFGLIIPVGIWGVNERYNWHTAGKVLVISCVTAMILYLVMMVTLFHHREIIDNIRWEARWDYSQTSWLTFFAENITVVKHRLYLCMVELFGMVMAYLLYRKKPLILIPSLLIMGSSLVLTASRQSVITAVALLVVIILFAIPEQKRLRYGIAIIFTGFVLGFGLMKIHPRMRNFDYQADQRINIWGAALQHPKDYIWDGLGAGQSGNYMMQQYEDLKMTTYAERRYNCHNQYLEETMEIGVFGLILFLMAWLSIPICAKGKARQTACLLAVLFLFNMFTECVFGRYDGIALWAVGMILILVHAHTEREQ